MCLALLQGASNGATGEVIGFKYQHGQLYGIDVRLDGRRSETITVTRTDCERRTAYKQSLFKHTFPLALAYAMTGGWRGRAHV